MPQPAVLLFIDSKITPLRNYVGRKGSSGVWQKVLSEIPKCELFIDAMCGSGLISSIVQETGCSIVVNDRDKSVIDKIRYAGSLIEFRNEDYKKIIDRYDNGHPGRVFYFDPPYLMESRKNQITMYNYDWTNADHERFIKAVKEIKCPALLSQYPNEKYNNALKKWRYIDYSSMTRRGKRIERLYMNYPQPVLLQCYKHIGENFTDRQRIKRKVERLINKLNNEQPQERAAILSSIIDRFSYVISKK